MQQPSPYQLPPYQPTAPASAPPRKRNILFIVLGVLGALTLMCVIAAVAVVVFGGSALQQASTAQATAQAATAVALSGEEQQLQASAEELFNESFDTNDTGFDISPAEGSTVAISDGVYQATLSENTSRSIFSQQELTSFITEVDCKVVQGGSDGACGIILGVHEVEGSDTNDDMFLYVTGGAYGIRTHVGGLETSKSFSNSAVHAEDGAVNNVRVVRVNDEARLYINGQLIDRVQVSDDTLKTGSVGFAVAAEESDAVVEVDNWKVYAIE